MKLSVFFASDCGVVSCLFEKHIPFIRRMCIASMFEVSLYFVYIRNILLFLESHRFCDRVQDAYTLRCTPQVILFLTVLSPLRYL